MKRKYNEGFTLVELMVGILIASVVTMAASTVLLLGMRLNRSSSDTAQRQNTTRIFMTVVERMATEGTITSVTDAPDYWKAVETVVDGEEEKERILFYYDAGKGIIYTGGEETVAPVAGKETVTYSGGTPLMEDVIASHVILEDALLTVSLETRDGSYSTSVYCRTADIQTAPEGPDIGDAEENLEAAPEEMKGREARAKLLKILLSQRGSTGMILVENEKTGAMYKTPVYYARWYEPDWPSDTPWCACFLSWGLDQVSGDVENTFLANVKKAEGGKNYWFANVDNFMRFFKEEIALQDGAYVSVTPPAETKHWVSMKNIDFTDGKNTAMLPNPGDIAFIDWTRAQADPAHVGIVLAVKDGYIYTVEGNSANTVAVRKYAVTDKLIMGYGIIDWKPDPS